MKRFLSMALCIVMALGILSGCGQKTNDTPKNDDNSTALSGSVSTNGSTSMDKVCLLYTSPSPRDPKTSRMPSSA